MSWYTSAKLWSFVGGIGAAIVGGLAYKSPQVREFAINAVAKGMQVQATAQENIQSLKDDAEDLAEQARRQAKIDAARADRRAAIEARIREQVEAEMAAEDAAEDEAAEKDASK